MSGAAAGISTRARMPRSRAPSVSAASTRSRRTLADRHRHHQDDLEHRADEDDEQLLHLADAGPQDQQRDEGGGRQIARERDERLEERLDRLVGAHQDADRHRDQRREHEAAEHAPDRHADVEQEAVLGQQQPAVLDHGERDRRGRSSRHSRRASRRPRRRRTARRTRCRARRVAVLETGARGFMRASGVTRPRATARAARGVAMRSSARGARHPHRAAASRDARSTRSTAASEHCALTARTAYRRASTGPGSA